MHSCRHQFNIMRVAKRASFCACLLFLAVHVPVSRSDAAVKVRVYPMGEAENGTVGTSVSFTDDIQVSPSKDSTGQPITDSGGFFVPMDALTVDGQPKYVAGRKGGTSLAIQFDGVDDYLQAAPFDPRDYAANGQQFNALSQAWIKPVISGQGRRQMVWQLGSDNGSVAISDTGFWELVPGGVAEIKVTTSAVAFDEWTHVAVLRTGNDGRIYINGELIEFSGGFWNGTGAQVVGANTGGGENFAGVIDDFNIAGFPDLVFNPATDIDYFQGLLTGVPGDIVQDSVIDIKDYDAWSVNAGFDNGLGAGDPFTQMKGDLDRNGRVNYFDLQLLIGFAEAAGTPLPNFVVPEPAGVILLMWGVMILSAGRRQR